MKKSRWKSLPPADQAETGFFLCRSCRQPCYGEFRFFCSRKCFDESMTVSSGGYVRAKLFERDQGVCSLCGMDTEPFRRTLVPFQEDLTHPLMFTLYPMIVLTLRSEGWTNVRLRGSGCYPEAIEFKSFWEADHILPVVEGGGECSLENYRTLCYICHKATTAELTARLAQERRKKARKSSKQ